MIFQNAHRSLFLLGFEGKTGRETARTAPVNQQPRIKIEEPHTGLRPTSSHELEMTKVEVVFGAVIWNPVPGPAWRPSSVVHRSSKSHIPIESAHTRRALKATKLVAASFCRRLLGVTEKLGSCS